MEPRALTLSLVMCACTAGIDVEPVTTDEPLPSGGQGSGHDPRQLSQNGWLFDAAGDGELTANVVFQQRVAEGTSLWTRRFVPGYGWGPPVLLAPTDPGIGEPMLVADEAGGAVAIWPRYESNGGWRLWSSRFVPTGGWSLPHTLDDGPGIGPLPADLAIAPGGTATVAWISNGVTSNELWTRRSTAGGWGAPVLVAAAPDLRSCAVNVDAAGTATVAWVDRGNVVAVRSDDGVAWSAPIVLDSDMTVEGAMRATSDDDGSVTVAWVGIRGLEDWGVFATRFVSGAGWSPPTAIMRGDVYSQPAIVQVAADHTGAVTAVWMQIGAIGWDIWTARFDGGTWSAPEPLEIDDDGSAEYADLGVDGHGNTIAAWTQFYGDDSAIRVRRFAPDEGWGPTQGYVTAPAEYSAYPRVVAGQHGARLVWMSSVGNWHTAEQYALWTARYQ
jgi:hypothetical protein